jgi:hypothetical protein
MRVRNACICMLGFVVLAMPLLGANAQTVAQDERATYGGTLKVYVAEPTSRWVNSNDGVAYHHGFLDYAMIKGISIPDGQRYETSATWNSQTAGYGNITQANIEAIAVVFDDLAVVTDGYPPSGSWFNAYYTDASALAKAGAVGQNSTGSGYTHSVFIEEGTASWCGPCTSVRDWLYNLERTGMNFNMVALVQDRNAKASERVDTLGLGAFPTNYYDGGYRVAVGASNQSTIATAINQTGARTTPGLDLIVSTKWQSTNTILVTVAIGNGVPANNAPAIPDITTGTDSSFPGVTCSFTALGTDPENHDLYYQWKFGDGDSTLWLGPFSAGVGSTITHQYEAYNQYEVTVRTKDIFGATTAWSAAHVVKIVNPSCCICLTVGNVDNTPDCLVTMGDLTVMIDNLFISLTPLTCDIAGNVDMSPDGLVTMGDLTVLIDNLFISLSPLPFCY